MLGGGYEYVAAIYRLPFIGITMWIFLLIFLGVGYLLTQQGYLLSSEMHSLYSRLSLQERQLRQLSSKLVYTEQTLVVKDRFISLGLLSAGLIHEFKNILGLILSCTQYGSAHNDPERLRQSLSLIEEHTRHGLKSVIGLLEKIKEKNTLTAEQFSMETFCFEILKVIRANYRGAGIDVVCQVHKDFDLSVRKAELEQAMLNIIRNAAKALNAFPQKKDKTIKIEISSDFDKGMLSISDNAGGIPSEIACNIFEPHFRSGKSTGMGLYLTKMMAEQLGVQLIYEPIKDGSRFTFIFPLA
ncbi:MAG: HAMP domain-containing sensor histidine kinase [Spirochaetia bacterium]